jgi:uncharacterized protein with NAD-binding domain and iron-sulfur cluster
MVPRNATRCGVVNTRVKHRPAPYRQSMQSVAVLGGGVGGLSAAHELAERGFKVDVYEARGQGSFGGKARSIPVPRSGTNNRPNLPAEHGFRFFPGFYRHLPDTMARIPCETGTAFDHLTATRRMLIAQAEGRNALIAPTETPSTLDDLAVAIKFMWEFGIELGIEPAELMFFFQRLLVLLCSCDERRYQQWDRVSWWDYTGAATKSPAFQKFLATGLTRTLVAAQAKQISARTGGLILCQLLFGMIRLGGRVDRVLDGPTSQVWIDPWIAHLRSSGVELHEDCTVAGIHCDGRCITGVTVREAGGGSTQVTADHYVAALPVERLRELVSSALRAAEPRLGALSQLVTRWMNGAMFYLRDDVPLVPGHAIFIDSPWALTAISQAQFWPDVDLTMRGNGRVRGILSVDVSDWNEPGPLTGKTAMECSVKEIREEVWHQMTEAIESLKTAKVDRFFLDPDIKFLNPTTTTNLEPLLINTAGSWAERPDAVTRIPNLFLAADFVRTYTDLATMEGANEAARRAVNGILSATGSRARPCPVWKLHEPALLAPFRALDWLRWQLRLPARSPFRVTSSGGLVPTDLLTRASLQAVRLAADRG